MPVSLRVPDTARSTAHGRTGIRCVQRRPLRRRDARREGVQQGVLVFLGRIGRGPPDPQVPKVPQEVEPEPGPGGLPVARDRLREPRDPPGHGARRGADEHDRLRRQPEAVQPQLEVLRHRPGAVEAEVRHALQPLADQREVQGGRRQGGRELHHEDARRLVPDLATPLDGTVGHEADLSEEGGGAAVVGHQVVHTLVAGGDRSGAATAVADHGAYRLTIMPNPSQEREPDPSGAPAARRTWTRPAAAAGLVAGVALVPPSSAARSRAARPARRSPSARPRRRRPRSRRPVQPPRPARRRRRPLRPPRPPSVRGDARPPRRRRPPAGLRHPRPHGLAAGPALARPAPAPPTEVTQSLAARLDARLQTLLKTLGDPRGLGRDRLGRRAPLVRRRGQRGHRDREGDDPGHRVRPRIGVEDAHGRGRAAAGGRGEARARPAGGAPPAGVQAGPADHRPHAARPHERAAGLLPQPEDRQAAPGEAGRRLDGAPGVAVRAGQACRPGQDLALLEHATTCSSASW